jgi:drug/metabolite transporter (DMT)-like permease
MGERLTTVKVMCAVTAVSGVVVAVLAAPTDDEQTTNLAVGYVWAVVSLLIWVAYLLLAKRAREGIETFRFMLVMSVVGAVTVSAVMPFVDQPIDSLDRSGWVWVVLLSLGPGIAGHGLLTWAHPRVDASVSSLLIQAEPVGATIAAWVFLGEKVSLLQALAMLVVLGALGVLAYREARDVGLALDEAIA